MKMRPILAILALLAASSIGHAQLRQNSDLRVKDDTPALAALTAVQNGIQSAYDEHKLILPGFSAWYRVNSPSGAILFPGLEFYTISWNENLHPDRPEDSPLIGRALGLEKTVAIESKTNKVSDDYSGFWNELVERKIAITNRKDAIQIWNAFCEIHHKHWQSSPCRKVSPTEWRLGISSYDQTVAADEKTKTIVTRTHYQKVLIDEATGAIISFESVVDTDNERTIPK